MVHIRQAYTHEVGEIAELWSELVAYHNTLDARLPLAAPYGEMLYAQRIREQMEHNNVRLLVGVSTDGRIVAYALGYIHMLTPNVFLQERGGFIADIYVQPAARRQGFGRALLDALRAWFVQEGVQTLEWDAAARNPEGRAFWQAMGGYDVMVRMQAKLPTAPKSGE